MRSRSNFGGDKTNENWAGRLNDLAVWTKALPVTSIASLAAGSMTPLTAPTGSSGGVLTTALASGPTTHYFRKTFTFSEAKERTTLALQHLLDDGAVFYLNGTEVLRVNLPGGAVTHATPASTDITSTVLSAALPISTSTLVSGTNVLSVEVHQHTANPDMVFGASLVASESPLLPVANPLVFSEITAASDAGFYVELRNTSASAVSTSGWSIAASSGQTVAIPAQSIASGGWLTLNAAALGFTPLDGTKLFLLAPGGTELRDARDVTNRLRGHRHQRDFLPGHRQLARAVDRAAQPQRRSGGREPVEAQRRRELPVSRSHADHRGRRLRRRGVGRERREHPLDMDHRDHRRLSGPRLESECFGPDELQ